LRNFKAYGIISKEQNNHQGNNNQIDSIKIKLIDIIKIKVIDKVIDK
jgi:hypothetical protein